MSHAASPARAAVSEFSIEHETGEIESELSFFESPRNESCTRISTGQLGPKTNFKEVMVPDDNKSNRGNRENEGRQSPSRESENDRGSSSTDRERDSKGRFESDDDSQGGSSSSRGGSGSSSGGSSKKK
jgi:hypothetical protein